MNRLKIESVTVGLAVTDVFHAAAWYRRVFGTVLEMIPMSGVLEMQVAPTFWIQLFEHEGRASGTTVVRFETHHIGVLHERISRMGTFVGPLEKVPGAVRYFEFRDPFGNLLSFYEPLEA